MARDLLSPVGILNATHPAMKRIASPWLGVLWIGLLPYRFLQVHFVREVLHLGGRAAEYGDYLNGLAWALFGALLPAVYARAVYVRATQLGMQSGAAVGVEALKVPPAVLLNSLYVALLTEAAFCITAWMFVTVPLLVVIAGLGYAAAGRTDRPGLLRPLAEVFRLFAGLRALCGLAGAFTLALLAVMVNVYMAFRMGLGAFDALGSEGLSRWEHLLRPIHPWFPLIPGEPLTALICGAGTLLVVEPFWLSALAVFAHRSTQRQTGEDLRLRFRMLTEAR